MRLFAGQVTRTIKPAEYLTERWMVDLTKIIARRQVALRDVSGVRRTIDHDVIPGLVCRWPAARDFLIPLFGKVELCVHTEDHAAIAELEVFDDLADKEARRRHASVAGGCAISIPPCAGKLFVK